MKGRAKMTEKTCPTCGERKPRDGFGESSRGGIRDKCRSCQSKAAVQWTKDNRPRFLENMRRSRQRNPESCRERKRRFAVSPRGRLIGRTRTAVYNAIQAGKLVRPSACQWCGRSCKPDAAHRQGGRSRVLDSGVSAAISVAHQGKDNHREQHHC